MSITPTISATEEKQNAARNAEKEQAEAKSKSAADTITPPAKSVSRSNEPSNALPEELAANLDQEKPAKDNKAAARWSFHLFNFLGLHFLFNSTVSLFIAYNLLPTKAAKATMNAVAKMATPVNAALSYITTPIMKMIQGKNFKELTKEEMTAKIAHSARSRVETAFMCFAGFLALAPVKYLEDHRAGFINFVDNLIHPGRTKEQREAVALKPEDEPKETWTNLIRARVVGLGVVFGVDALQQQFNNALGYKKGNIDTAVWQWGARTSDKMENSSTWRGIRNGIVNFFTRKNITLSGIQTHIDPENDMRGHLLEKIGAPQEMRKASRDMAVLQDQIQKSTNKSAIEGLSKRVEQINDSLLKNPILKKDMERAIFAEQARLLLTKEVFLTLVVSATIYTAAKAPFMARFFEKIGLKKKEEPKMPEADAKAAVAAAPPPTASEPATTTNHADAVTPRKAAITPSKDRTGQFADQYSTKPDWQASVTKADAENPSLSQAV